MARIEKGSRIRGLPPRIQLQQRDAVTGSYPTITRCSSDNRTGTRKISFNDLYTPVFTYRDNMLWPSGVPSGSLYVTDEEYVTTLSGSGSLRKGVGDQFYCGNTEIISGAFAPQELMPFKDNSNRSVDAKSWSCNDVIVSKLDTEKNYAFYATGSLIDDVGEGFTAPLWSKQKIEIPIIISSENTVVDKTGSTSESISSSYRMAYYNFDKKVWDPIGQGLGYGSFLTGEIALVPAWSGDFNSAINSFTCGVAPSMLIPNFDHLTGTLSGTAGSAFAVAGDVISTFGFPFGPKYHATSSQCLRMSAYINEPFILEKVVLTTSASFEVGTLIYIDSPTSRSLSAFNTVFLLNQRNNINLRYDRSVQNIRFVPGDVSKDVKQATTAHLPTSSQLTSEADNSGPVTYVDTVRDIICYHKILSCAEGVYETKFDFSQLSSSLSDLQFFDTLITSSVTNISGINWNKNLQLEMVARTPAQRPFESSFFNIKSDGYSPVYSFPEGGRNGLGMYLQSGRSLGGTFVSSNPILTFVGSIPYYLPYIDSNLRTGTPFNVSVANRLHKNNPYILMPQDDLVLCWHLPVMFDASLDIDWNHTNGEACRITFAPGEYKLTLYGSYLKEGKEKNDTLNQLLTSNVVHEVIGN